MNSPTEFAFEVAKSGPPHAYRFIRYYAAGDNRTIRLEFQLEKDVLDSFPILKIFYLSDSLYPYILVHDYTSSISLKLESKDLKDLIQRWKTLHQKIRQIESIVWHLYPDLEITKIFFDSHHHQLEIYFNKFTSIAWSPMDPNYYSLTSEQGYFGANSIGSLLTKWKQKSQSN